MWSFVCLVNLSSLVNNIPHLTHSKSDDGVEEQEASPADVAKLSLDRSELSPDCDEFSVDDDLMCVCK